MKSILFGLLLVMLIALINATTQFGGILGPSDYVRGYGGERRFSGWRHFARDRDIDGFRVYRRFRGDRRFRGERGGLVASILR